MDEVTDDFTVGKKDKGEIIDKLVQDLYKTDTTCRLDGM